MRHRDAPRIRAAIEAAERRTSAEVVVSVAPFFLGSVAAAARRAFARLGVAATRARNGVLIFVVPSRRQLIVLADAQAEARMGPACLAEVARRIAAGFGRGRGTEGLLAGIEHVADGLATAFPRTPDDVNELADAPDFVAAGPR